jgi:hypothetical protein
MTLYKASKVVVSQQAQVSQSPKCHLHLHRRAGAPSRHLSQPPSFKGDRLGHRWPQPRQRWEERLLETG